MSTFLTARMPASLVNELKALAKLERAPTGCVPALAAEYGYAVGTLKNALSDLRGDRRDGEGVVAPVACVAPAHDGRAVGQVVCDLDVSSLNLGARGESRAVAPAAGPCPPPPCERGTQRPAAVFSEDAPSPGLCWAREMMGRGVPVAKILSSAGDRLGWRERDALRAGRVAP